MAMTRYMISDAARQVDVEAHVLRYWEEELEIEIRRNEMGHRYYTDEDIVRLREIREMKERGFGLKAIKMVLHNEGNLDKPIVERDQKQGAKELFRSLMSQILQENNQELVRVMNEEVGDRVIKQVDYLFREQEEREEERFQRFDEMLRLRQKKKRRLCRK